MIYVAWALTLVEQSRSLIRSSHESSGMLRGYPRAKGPSTPHHGGHNAWQQSLRWPAFISHGLGLWGTSDWSGTSYGVLADRIYRPTRRFPFTGPDAGFRLTTPTFANL